MAEDGQVEISEGGKKNGVEGEKLLQRGNGKFGVKAQVSFDATSNQSVEIRDVTDLDQLEDLKLNDKLKYIFDLFDKDGNGEVCRSEFNLLIQKLKDCKIPISQNKEARIFDRADRNCDDKLQFNEFIKLMLDPENDIIFSKLKVRLGLNKLQNYANTFLGRKKESVHYNEEFSCRPPPIMIMILTILQIAFFFIEDVDVKKALYYDPEKKEEVWRFFTYMLIHTDEAHLISNMIFQIGFGIPMEMVHQWRVGVVYLAGVIFGCLVFSCYDGGHLLAGASGGVYSLITAQLAIIFMNWSEIAYPFVNSIILGIFVVVDLTISSLEKSSSIAYLAHLGGAIAGVLVGTKILRNLVVRKYETIIEWISIIIFLLLTVAAIIYNIITSNKS